MMCFVGRAYLVAESKCEYLQVGVVNVTKGRGVKKVLDQWSRKLSVRVWGRVRGQFLL